MAKPLFNSLGSNYSAEFVKTSLAGLFFARSENYQKVKDVLAKRFAGDVELVYKGRDAIELALRVVRANHKNPSHKKLAVLTQGLACHAIEEAIIRAGMVPVYADLDNERHLSPTVATLNTALKRAKENELTVCAVFLQHTLGYANPVSEVRRWCDEKEFVLIEDVAQSFGAKDDTGRELGTSADIVICSFGRDKVIDAVSGGAVIVRKKFANTLAEVSAEVMGKDSFPPLKHMYKELLYPFFTWVVRGTHQIGIGKVLFQALKALGMFTSPIASPTTVPTVLPAGYCGMILWQLSSLEEQLEHRRALAKVYMEGLADLKYIKCLVNKDTLDSDIHLRVPIVCESSELMDKIILECKKHDIHLTDRWYRKVVDSGSLHLHSIYTPGDCPVAEDVSQRLFNLPTHRQITVSDAKWIVHVITQVK